MDFEIHWANMYFGFPGSSSFSKRHLRRPTRHIMQSLHRYGGYSLTIPFLVSGWTALGFSVSEGIPKMLFVHLMIRR